MLDTALTQLRYGLALVFNRRIRIEDVRRLVSDILATRAELGEMGEEQANSLRGAALSPDARRTVNERRMKITAAKVYNETAYYRELFDRIGIKPDEVTLDRLKDIPVTPKKALKIMPAAFIGSKSQPSFQAFTTGTTGHPTSVWFSTYEVELAAALSAIAFITNVGMKPEDVVQINISSRATIGIFNTMQGCRLVGAASYPVGLIDPEETLSRLAMPVHLPGKKLQASFMTIYPSYLGALVERGEALGYCADDFGLERILCGSEILTQAMRCRAEKLFGAKLYDSYAMTEIFPLAGLVCSQGHLHLTPEQGLIEVLRPGDHRPTAPGEIGTLVATPFFPYRDTTLIFRMDTGDVVRRLDNSALDCEFAALPATSPILGKMSLCVEAGERLYFQRDVLELLEAEAAIPLPCRYSVQPVDDGFDLHVLARSDDAAVARRLEKSAEERGLPLRSLTLHTGLAGMPPTMPVRSDLREITFTRLRD